MKFLPQAMNWAAARRREAQVNKPPCRKRDRKRRSLQLRLQKAFRNNCIEQQESSLALISEFCLALRSMFKHQHQIRAEKQQVHTAKQKVCPRQ